MLQMVSIIMPAYNAGKYIAESIESVLLQSHTMWELIIVDDESSDNTAEVVKHYLLNDSRIIYKWQKNCKQGKTRNTAIQMARGEYLAFLDADDVWMPSKLEWQLKQLNQQNVDLVFGYSYVIENQVKTNIVRGRGNGYYFKEEAIKFLLLNDAFLISTVLVKKEVIIKIGLFNVDLKIQYCEDWHIWLKLALSGFSFYSDSQIVAYYRVHSESFAMNEKDAKAKLFYALFDLYQQYPNQIHLKEEVRKRSINLILHNEILSEGLVKSIIEFHRQIDYSRISWRLYESLYRVSISIFRKYFLLLNKL